jgi:oligosaccharide repeat unit polymerase
VSISNLTASPVRLSIGESSSLLCGLALLIGGLLAVAFVRPDVDVYFLCFTMLTALLAVPLVIGCVTRRMDLFDPTMILAASYFLYFVYAPMRNLLAGRDYFFGKLVMPLLPAGSLYLAVGIVSMWIGYYSSNAARRVARFLPSPPTSRRGAVPYAWVVVAVALVAFNAYAHMAGLSWTRLLTLGQFGNATTALSGEAPLGGSAFSNYLYGTLDWLTSALMLLYAFARRGRKWLTVAFVALFLVYTTIGFRIRVVVLILAPIVYYYLKAKRRPTVLKVMALAGAMMLLIGAIGLLRGSFRPGERVDAGNVTIASSSQTFASDLDIYQGYLAIIDAFPRDHQYLWGSSFTYLFIQPIPRSLWPEKPDAPVLAILDAILGVDAITAGVAYPNAGEYYANFGAAGLVAGMWLFGFLVRALYEYIREHADNEWALVVYAVTLPFLVQVISRGYFVQIVQEAAFLLLPLVLGMWVCRGGKRGHSHDAMSHERLSIAADRSA